MTTLATPIVTALATPLVTMAGASKPLLPVISSTITIMAGDACATPPAAPLYPRMTRLFIHPDWVGLLDFETRLPSAVERAIARAQAGA